MKKINITQLPLSSLPLGITLQGKDILLYTTQSSKNKTIFIHKSVNAQVFEKDQSIAQIIHNDTPETVNKIRTFMTGNIGETIIATYLRQTDLAIATSSDLHTWHYRGRIKQVSEPGAIVPGYKYKKQYVIYSGNHGLTAHYSSDLKRWTSSKKSIVITNDQITIGVLGALLVSQGILVIYYTKMAIDRFPIYTLHAVLLDKNAPENILWKLESFWNEPWQWLDKEIKPLGIVEIAGILHSYWYIVHDNTFFSISHPLFSDIDKLQDQSSFLILHKYKDNPILAPKSKNYWESQAVFNPTAIHEGGKTHILYRAVGEKYISVLGYAASEDGVTISERLDQPAYVPRESFEGNHYGPPPFGSRYISGPGWGGCEDPRLTKIDDRIYLLYVAHNGWNPPRVAMSSIAIKDFLNKCWSWEKPVLISQPGVVDKNACILPEKVNGKYVIFHRIFPHILIDFVDDLNFDGKTKFLKGQYRISPRDNAWDSRKVGTGPTPLKTKDGWLLIYHAVDDRQDNEYKMGAMLLDYKDPTKVIARSIKPILEPREWYENNGHKSGVPYPCGATLVNETLFVYYGGADSVVCVATANINTFLGHLQTTSSAKVKPILIH